LAGCALFAVVYFVIVNMLILPRLGAQGIIRYDYLGSNYLEIAKTLITKPKETLRILFANTNMPSRYDGVKAEFYFCALLTGMVFTLLKPNFLLMLVPLIAQKMLSIDPTFWGISFQYSVEFMPIIVIASFLVIVKLRKKIWRMTLASCLLLSTVLTTFYTIGIPKSQVWLDQLCVYQGRHYEQKDFDVHFAYEVIKQIPDEASVCAITQFVPHLALRDEIRNFSDTRDVKTDYVLITAPYFEYERRGVLVLKNRDEYETVATDGTIYLLRRIVP
jgi:uncharacterized membrane protein